MLIGPNHSAFATNTLLGASPVGFYLTFKLESCHQGLLKHDYNRDEEQAGIFNLKMNN